MLEKIDIKSMELPELEAYVTGALGEKSFRAKQIYEWLHLRLVDTFDEMSNLPLSLRQKLNEQCDLMTLKMVRKYVSGIDGTVKYVFMLPDGNVIESVLMKYKHGNSVCISSQVGCRMGCRFCASTLDGLEEQMTPSQMLDEIYRIRKDSGEKVSNLVVMGTGEPLDNYDNLLKMIRIISGNGGLNISQRNITVSTCGIVPKIYELAGQKLQITLAISLHASDDETRKKIMPVARSWGISELLDACRYYYDMTGRRISFEYSLIGGVNDYPAEAKKLAALLRGLNCHVNLIPVNPVKERGYHQTARRGVSEFKTILENNGRTVTIRREMGRDIRAACGQLRKQYKDSCQEQ